MENIKCLKPPTRIYQVDELANELHNCLSSIFFKRHLLPSLIHFSSIPIYYSIYYMYLYIYIYIYIYIYTYIYIYVWGTFRSYYAYAGCSRLHRYKRFTRIKRIEIIKRFDRFKYLILLNLLIHQSFKRFKRFKYLILLNLLIPQSFKRFKSQEVSRISCPLGISNI